MLNHINNMQEEASEASVHLVVSPSNIAKKAFFYAQEIGYYEMLPSCIVEKDNTNSFLLLDVVFGEGTLFYENNEFHLKKDTIFLIDCKKYHKYVTTRKLNILYLYFNGKQAREYYNIISRNKFSLFNIENHKTIMSLFWQIIVLHQKNDIQAEYLTSLHLTRLLTELIILKNNKSVSDVEYPEYINDIFHRIDHFYKEKFTLDMLAELYSINKFHILREFKRCSGSTVNEYLIKTRINKAKTMLRYSDKSVDQIAEEVGFYNSSHLIKMFYKQEHVTPLYYRKQWTK